MTISESYRKQLIDIHTNTPFGKRGKIPKDLKKLIKEKNPQSILDFGCGKGRMTAALKEDYPNIAVTSYDPGNPEFNISLDNVYVDLLASTDVLEHVEPEFIEETLGNIRTKSRYFYHLISCAPAKLILPDGRNAHLIQETPEWWKSLFEKAGYTVVTEDYREFWKESKELKKPMLVKNYIISGETNYGKP